MMRWKALRCFLLLACLVTLASQARAQSKEVPITEEARKHFREGVAFLEDPEGPRYAKAYEAFRRAYAASPSPKILSNLGLSAMMLERDGEALEAIERYLREVDDVDPRERQKLEESLAKLRAGMATATVTVTPSAARIIDRRIVETGPPVENRYEASAWRNGIGIRAGRHEITIEADGHQHATKSFEVAAGEKIARSVTLEPIVSSASPAPMPGETPDPSPRAGDSGGLGAGTVAAIVVTSALTVGAIVVGALALDTKSKYDAYRFGGDREEAENVRSDGVVLNGVTDGLIGAAVVAAGVTTILVIVDLTSKSDDAAVAVTPSFSLEGAGIEARVKF